MYIIPIAWLYVTLMMAVTEANASNGSLLGAVITFVLYGLLPIALMLYFMGTPARRRAIREREAAQSVIPPREDSVEPDAGDLSAADTVPPVRKEP